VTDADVDFWTRFAESFTALLANGLSCDVVRGWRSRRSCLPYLGLHASFRRQTLTTRSRCLNARSPGWRCVLAFPSLAIGADGKAIPLAVLFGVAAGVTGVGLFVAARFRREGAVLGVAAPCFVAAPCGVTEVARALSPFGETRLENLSFTASVLGRHPRNSRGSDFSSSSGDDRTTVATRVAVDGGAPDAARAAGISPRRASATFAAALGTAVHPLHAVPRSPAHLGTHAPARRIRPP
jgi:hypothetical protein